MGKQGETQEGQPRPDRTVASLDVVLDLTNGYLGVVLEQVDSWVHPFETLIPGIYDES